MRSQVKINFSISIRIKLSIDYFYFILVLEQNEGALKSETLVKEKKRYYLDLKENDRGRFLRIAMVVSRGPRAQIAIPAQGLKEFRENLTEILDKYNDGTTDDAGSGNEQNKPEALQFTNANSKSLKASNKTFYFDLGSNARGSFLKINEVRANQFRTNITVPVKFIEAFRDQLTLVLQEDATKQALLSATNEADDEEQDKETTTVNSNESKA
jgi:transcriptional activator protein Pur-alpha